MIIFSKILSEKLSDKEGNFDENGENSLDNDNGIGGLVYVLVKKDAKSMSNLIDFFYNSPVFDQFYQYKTKEKNIDKKDFIQNKLNEYENIFISLFYSGELYGEIKNNIDSIRKGKSKLAKDFLSFVLNVLHKKGFKNFKEVIESLDKTLNEKVTPKEPIAKDGAEHAVYPSVKNPDVIFKVNKMGGKLDLKIVNFFKKYPQYFPVVGRYNERYVELEKLDTYESIMDFDDMYYAYDQLIPKFPFMEDYKSLFDLFNYGIGHNEIPLKDLKFFFITWKKSFPDEYEIFLDYKNLIGAILPLAQKELGMKTLDIHYKQFGYAKDGTLKMLDI